MRYLIGGLSLAAIVMAILLAIDLSAKTPDVPAGRCVFQDNLILPDRCLSSCRSKADCPTANTRSYFIFWTEAAGCPQVVICGGG